MISCSQCGAKYNQEDKRKYCVQCGTKLQGSKEETIVCLQCNNQIKPSSYCRICGLSYSKTEILLLKEIKKLKNTISTINRTNLDRSIDEEISTPSIPDLQIQQPEEATEGIGIIDTSPIDVQDDIQPMETEEIESPSIPAEIIPAEVTHPKTTLKISKPEGFTFDYQRERKIEPIDLPGLGAQTTVIEEKTFIQRAAELVEGPFLTVMGVFTAVMTMIFFAQVVGWGALFQGYVFSIMGSILILTGYSMVIGKFPFFGPERGLGLLVSSIGYILAEIFAIGTGNLYMISVVSTLGTGLIVYIGFRQYSEIMLIQATSFTILLPIFLSNSGFDIQLISSLSMGGGAFFVLISGLIATYAGRKEISFYPAIINLILGPIISMSIMNNIPIDIIYPSIGICLSIIPTAILLLKDKILILDFYYDLLLKFTIVYPVVIFVILHSSQNSAYRELDPLIFFVGYIISLGAVFYSTDSLSPVFTQLKQSNMNIVTAAIPIVAILVALAISDNYSDKPEWAIGIVGFIGMSYLIPIIYNQYEGLYLDFRILDGILAIISGTLLINANRSTNTINVYFGVGILLLMVAIIRFSLEHLRDKNSIFDSESIHLFIFLLILNLGQINLYPVLLPLFCLFVIPLLFSSITDVDRVKSYTNLVVTNIAILSSYYMMTRGTIDNTVQFNFLIVILSFVSAVVISGGILYGLRLDKSENIPIPPSSTLLTTSYLFLINNLNIVINIGIQAVFLSYLMKIYEIVGTDLLNSQYLLIIISSITAITLGLLVIARDENWMAIIPGLFTLSISYNLISHYTILSIIFGLYITCSLLLNALDRINKQANASYRIFLRDIVLWTTFIFTLVHSVIPEYLIYLIYGGLIGHALVSEFLRINNPLNSITLVFGSTIIVNMLNQSIILTYMAYASISLSIAFFVIQYFIVDGSFELLPSIQSQIGDFLSLRYIFPLIGLATFTTSSELVMSPLLIACIFIAVMSGMLIITRSHNLTLVGLAIISTIVLQQYPVITEMELFAIVGAIATICVSFIFSNKDETSAFSGSALTWLLFVPANLHFEIGYQILTLCIIGITLIIENYKGRSHTYDYLPVVFFSFIAQFMSLSFYFFVPGLILLGYSLVPIFSEDNKSEAYSDTFLAIGFALSLAPLHINASIISTWVLMVSGILAIVVNQYLQTSNKSWFATSLVVTLGSGIISIDFMEISLLYFVLHFVVFNLSKTRNMEFDKTTQYIPIAMMIHLLLIVETSLIYPIMAISAFLIYSYSVDSSKIMREINLVGLLLFATIGTIFTGSDSISLKVFTVLIMISIWLYKISNLNIKDQNQDKINIRNTRIIGILQLALVSLILWNLDFIFNEIHTIISLGIAMVSFSYFIWSKSSDIMTDTITVVSLATSAVLLQDVGAMFILGTIILNIIYMAIIALVDSSKISIEELSVFGLSYVILGTLQSFTPFVTNIQTELVPIFDYSWVVTYLIWISVTLFTIFNSDLSIQIGDREIKLNSLMDIVIYSMAIQGVVMIAWSNLTSIISLLILSSLLSIGIFVTILLKNEIAIDNAKPIDKIFASFFILLFTGMFGVNNLTISVGNFDIQGGIIFILFSILPIIFGLIVYTNRGYRNLELEQIVRERLFVYVILGFLASVLFMDYTIDLVPIIHFATALFMWSILLIGAWNNDVILTTIGSIYVYTAAYFLGNNYVYTIADAQFTASIPIVIFIALTVVLYLFRAEFEYRFQQGHHPLLLVSIGALIFTSFQTDNFRILGSSTSVATTMVTVLFSLVGGLVYIYGTKFRRGRYQGLGIVLIFLNLTRGLLLFLSRIAGLQESTEANALLSLISFLWATIMIGLVGGIRSLSKRDDLNRVLSALFKPIDRSQSPSEE